MQIHETSTDYVNPHRPLPVALINRAGRAVRRSGLGGRLDTDRLIAAAKRGTGLSDFGDEWFLEPLEVLIRSINEEARLTAVGNALQKMRIVSLLSVRLRAEQILREHPEILDVDLGRIILIAGLQRTATTTLQRLIAADPDMRELRTWEALNPVPLPGEHRGDSRRRERVARLAVWMVGYLAPDFSTVHPVGYDAPEEDVFLLDLSFMSQSPEATMHVPGYAAWLERQDQTRCYEYMLTMLRLLHWQRAAQNTVLKTPNHLEHLDVILRALPETCVVQTHRDPKKSVASFCSMVAHSRGMLSDHVDTDAIGSHWTRKIRRMMERSIQVRREGNSGAFVDVSYYDLVESPIDELARIYRHAGIEFSETASRAAQALVRPSREGRHGKHVYSLADFGLKASEMDARYGFYRREFRIPHENTGQAGR